MRSRFSFIFAAPLFLLVGALPTGLHAQSATTSFDLPAQLLVDSLKAIASQSNSNVFYDPALVEGRKAPALKVQATVGNALDQLLDGTGLTYRYSDDKTIMIVLEGAEGKHTAETAQGKVMRLAQADANNPETPGSATAAGENQGTNETTNQPSSSEEAGLKLEEIVVTAERREESIQDMPIAISAFSGKDLMERGIEDMEAVQELSPSFQMTVQPGLNVRIGMRGVHNTPDGEAPVAISRDGVAYAEHNLLPGAFFDVERIEVLRGPQGTMSGRNSTAGAIHVHSARPTEEVEGSTKASLGNYDRLELEGVLSGPIIKDRLLGRLAVRTDRADGWITNTVRDEEIGIIDTQQARASFLARPTDNFEALLILEGTRAQSNSLGGSVYLDERGRPDQPTLTEVTGQPGFDRGNRTIFLDHPTSRDTEQYNATLRLDWQLGASAQLTAITGFVEQDVESKPAFGYRNTGTPTPLENQLSVDVATRHFSQEVTLTADLTDRLDMIVGALYLDSYRVLFVTQSVPFLDLVQRKPGDLTSWAGYTQWRYRLTDQLRLTAGVRYTHDSKVNIEEISSVAGVPRARFIDNENSWNAWTPRFAVDYAASEDMTIFASASRGFKSGGLTAGDAAFDSEYVWNYEAGVKSTWWDDRARIVLSGFYMDYTDLQQQLSVFDPTNPSAGPEGFVSPVTNANSASVVGIELETEALVTNQFRLAFAGTWLDPTYDDFSQPDPLFPELGAPLPVAPAGPNFRDLSGNQLMHASKWKFNVSGEYRVPLAWGGLGGNWEGVLRATYAWQDKVYYSFFNHESASQDAYGLINLFGAIETSDGRLQLSAYVHNLTDKFYVKTRDVTVDPTFPSPLAIVRGFLGEPRRYGVSLTYRF